MNRSLVMITFATLAAIFSMTLGLASDKDPNKVSSATKTQAPSIHAGHGKVISVDKQAGKVRLAHDAIKSLNWPKMTMDFQVLNKALLNNIVPGTNVNFDVVMLDGGGYYISKIVHAAN